VSDDFERCFDRGLSLRTKMIVVCGKRAGKLRGALSLSATTAKDCPKRRMARGDAGDDVFERMIEPRFNGIRRTATRTRGRQRRKATPVPDAAMMVDGKTRCCSREIKRDQSKEQNFKKMDCAEVQEARSAHGNVVACGKVEILRFRCR
jgi:hypothetical protein